jgi:hypothetical protein
MKIVTQFVSVLEIQLADATEMVCVELLLIMDAPRHFVIVEETSSVVIAD